MAEPAVEWTLEEVEGFITARFAELPTRGLRCLYLLGFLAKAIIDRSDDPILRHLAARVAEIKKS